MEKNGKSAVLILLSEAFHSRANFSMDHLDLRAIAMVDWRRTFNAKPAPLPRFQ